jgi:putative FmdB family regulatory protein
MPTYAYACEACGHEFEEFQSIKARPLRKCPACGKSALKRLLGTGAGIIFKGSGFYETDYRSESYKKAAEKDKGPAAPKSGDKKTDKPENKPATAETSSSTSPKKKTA